MANQRLPPPIILINFVDPKTGASSTREFEFPGEQNRKGKRHPNSTLWNREQASTRFIWYLSRQKIDGLEIALDALIRLDYFGEALKQCKKGPRPNIGKVKTLLMLWNVRGLWSIPRALRENLWLFTDILRHFVPQYDGPGLTLYRGQCRGRHKNGVYGIAWTSRREIAEQFSKLRDTPGVVVKMNASTDMIVLRVSDFISTSKTNEKNLSEYEDEFLICPRLLTGKVSVA
jgi:hypothetical protein